MNNLDRPKPSLWSVLLKFVSHSKVQYGERLFKNMKGMKDGKEIKDNKFLILEFVIRIYWVDTSLGCVPFVDRKLKILFGHYRSIFFSTVSFQQNKEDLHVNVYVTSGYFY